MVVIAVVVVVDVIVSLVQIAVAFGWLISVAGISTSVYLSHSYTYAGDQWPVEAVVAFLSLQRLVFAVGVAWIIYACCTGYGGQYRLVFHTSSLITTSSYSFPVAIKVGLYFLIFN